MKFLLLCALAIGVSVAQVTPQLRADADKIIDAALAEKTFVWDRLAYVTDTFGPRFSGTQALEDALTSIRNTMVGDGLKVAEEKVMIPKWVRGNEYAKMLQPRVKPLHFLGLGMSGGTGGKAIQAEILVVKSFDELQAKRDQVPGKIVVYNQPWVSYGVTVAYRSQGASRAAQYGAVAALVRSVAPYGIQTVHTGTTGSAPIPSGCISIEDALQLQRMQDRGQKVVIELMMEAHMEPDVASRNLVVTLNGTEKPDEFVVIGGHIDSWDVAEGAMDDGAGAFVSWEAVRLIQSLGLKPKRSIRAVMFVNEENGARGGRQYAIDHAAELNRTSLAIETDAGTFTPFRLGFEGSDRAWNIIQSLAPLLARIGAGNVTRGGSGTDIDPMCRQGVPCAALEILDQRVGPYSNNPCLGFNYFWYHHTSADTIDKLDPTQLQLSTASMGVWAYAIASLDNLLPRN